MTKKIMIGLASLLFGLTVYAGMGMIAGWTFSYSTVAGTTCQVVIPPGPGHTVLRNWSYSFDTGADTKLAKRFIATKASKTIAPITTAGTSLTFKVDNSAGTLGGVTLANSQYLILNDASTNAGGWQLLDIAAVVSGVTTSDVNLYKTLQLAANATWGGSQDVYFVTAGNAMTQTITAAATDREWQAFDAIGGMPIVVQIISTNGAEQSGYVEYWN
jgi:hypothetical protein